MPTVTTTITINFKEESPDSIAKLSDTPPVHFSSNRPCSPPNSGQKWKLAEGGSSQDPFVDIVAGVFKGGGSSVSVVEERAESSKQVAPDDNAVVQDEDDHDAHACPVVESPPSSQGN